MVLTGKASYSAPVTRLGLWLADPGKSVPADVRPTMLDGLFGTLAIFFGGVFNTIAVSAVAAIRHPEPLFIGWAVYEAVLGGVRLAVLAHARRNARLGRRTFTDAYLFLALMWALGVGYGCLIGLTSGDALLAGITTISAAAMAGGISFRNFYAPRLCMLMVVLSFAPAAVGGLLSDQWVLWLLLVQVPTYLYALSKAITGLNAMLIRTLAAERENDRRASHDQLTGLANRAGLERAIAAWRDDEGRRGMAALYYLDLDGFKAVNDRHGHGAGDSLLRMVASRLQALAPAGGIAARVGGDEFVLLVPESDGRGTLGRAERVIAAIASHPYDLDDGVSVTVGTSIGVAWMPEHGCDLGLLMSVADSALYEAKARGRCRAVIASAPAPRVAALSGARQSAGG